MGSKLKEQHDNFVTELRNVCSLNGITCRNSRSKHENATDLDFIVDTPYLPYGVIAHPTRSDKHCVPVITVDRWSRSISRVLVVIQADGYPCYNILRVLRRGKFQLGVEDQKPYYLMDPVNSIPFISYCLGEPWATN